MAPRKKEINELIQERSRKNILMAAFGLFGEYGYARTSVDSIARKAKVSKGLIYHYFDGKQDILKGLFMLLQEETASLFDWNRELPAEQFLERLIRFSIEYIVHQKRTNRLMIALTIQPDVIRGLKKEIEKMRDEWMGLLSHLFAELKYKDPEGEAYLLGATLDGLSIGYIAMGEDYPVEKVKRLIEKRYLRK